MAQQNPSPGRPFRSRFGGGYVGAQEYLAEGMCARQAKRDRAELPERFWDMGGWKTEFLRQVRHAIALLKDFSVEAIVAALKTTRGKKVYSLGLKSVLAPLIRDEQERLNARKAAAELMAQAEPKPAEPEKPAEVEGPRPAFVQNPSLLEKLRGL